MLPNTTLLAPDRLLPVIVTRVPPACDPRAGFSLLSEGGATKVNRSAAITALVTPAVVTRT